MKKQQQTASLPVRILATFAMWALVVLLVLILAQPLMGCSGSTENVSSPIMGMMIILSIIGLAVLVGAIWNLYGGLKKDKKR